MILKRLKKILVKNQVIFIMFECIIKNVCLDEDEDDDLEVPAKRVKLNINDVDNEKGTVYMHSCMYDIILYFNSLDNGDNHTYTLVCSSNFNGDHMHDGTCMFMTPSASNYIQLS